MNLFFWKQKNTDDTGVYAPYEEIDAKRTSKLGYFFLILMVIFGVWQGNNFLSALQASITAPQANSQCMSVLAQYAGNAARPQDSYYYGYGSNIPAQGTCVFSEREISLSLDGAYRNVEPTLSAISISENNISVLNSQISDAQYNRNQIVTDYQVSLLENIARTQGTAFDQGVLQSGIITQSEYLERLRVTLTQEESRKQMLVSEAQRISAQYNKAIDTARKGYSHDMVVYQFEQFLLSLLFIVPLFLFMWRRYNLSKMRRSEYAIIWGGIVATVGLILAQILLVFVYEILPRQILQKVFALLSEIKIVWALLYWLGFILVPLFFGFLIYLIQKKFYNKRAIMMRALKSEHCPGCSLKINQGMNHCPVCGYALKTRCASCGAMSMNGGSFCETCGVKNQGNP